MYLYLTEEQEEMKKMKEMKEMKGMKEMKEIFSVILAKNCRIVIARAKPEANRKYRMLVCFTTFAMTAKYNITLTD
jgi:hypothetical protein